MVFANQKTGLFLRRTSGVLITLTLIFGTWFLLFYLNVIQQNLQSDSSVQVSKWPFGDGGLPLSLLGLATDSHICFFVIDDVGTDHRLYCSRGSGVYLRPHARADGHDH